MEVGANYSTQQFCCLYTKMKTQKRKIWQDGRLVIAGKTVCLYDAHPPPGASDVQFEQTELSGPQLQSLLQRLETRIETDKFLIQIEGPWQVASRTCSLPMSAVPLVSKGMHKVIARKFQKPGSFVPPNPKEQQQQQPQNLGKRLRAPLQPGDLIKRYYGNQQTINQELGMSWNNQQQSRCGLNRAGNYPPNEVSEARQRCQQGSGLEKVGPSNWRSGSALQPVRSPPNQRNMLPPLIHQQLQSHTNPSQVSWSSASRPSFAGPNNPYRTQPIEDPKTDCPAPITIALEKEDREKQGFASNGFNADLYDGEEEESGDEDESPNQFRWNQYVRPPAELTTETDDASNPFQVPSSPPIGPPTSPTAPPLQLPPSFPKKYTAETASESLSRKQLLALLGGGEESADSQADVSQATTRLLVEASKNGSSDERDNPEKQPFEFVLPSASDSSSDETENESQRSTGVV